MDDYKFTLITDMKMLEYYVMALDIVDEVDSLSNQFDPTVINPDIIKAMERVTTMLVCSIGVGLGIEANDATAASLVGCLRAAFILGRRAGTITLRVADEDSA
jgi:hypothetical protein